MNYEIFTELSIENYCVESLNLPQRNILKDLINNLE